MTFFKTHYKLLAFSIICITGLTIFLWYPRIEKIPVVYPKYNFYTGQSLSEIKNILGNKIYEPDNDAGRRYCRYIVFDDASANPKVRIHSFLTFYKNHLVSFYSQFRVTDSAYNLTEWLGNRFSQIVKNTGYKKTTKNGKFRFKLNKNNIFTDLAIDQKYSEFSVSTYLIGDYRYKEIDWDDD